MPKNLTCLPLLVLGLATFATLGCSNKDPIVVASGCDAIKVLDKAGQPVAVGSGEQGDCSNLCTVVNSEFCAAQATTNDCSSTSADIDVCGVSIKAPPSDAGTGTVLELKRSANVDEYSGSGAPDLSCYFSDGYPSPPKTAESKLVTVNGIAKIFSHGCMSKDLTIEIHTVKRGGSEDGMPGPLVGEAVITKKNCEATGVAEENEDCGTRYECKYSYPNVPTETELLIITDGAIWAPIYEYGLFIPNSEAADDTYEKDVRALAQDDYQVIAQVAMGKNITPGHGAVAGEVHDCGDVRLINAVVDVNVEKFITTYFTDNEENPLPDLSAKATSTLGLYSSLDIEPGPVLVGAAGVVDGKLVGVGHFALRAFPDAVTSFTFRGLRPFQVPK